MAENNESLISLLHTLNKIENDVVKAKAMVQKMFEEAGSPSAFQAVPTPSVETHSSEEEDGSMQTVEGKFDGTFMIAAD